MRQKIRVVILDDHLSVIYGHMRALEPAANIEVVGTAQTGEEVEPLLAAHRADVLLLDIGVPTSRDNPNPYPILHLLPHWLERYRNLAVLIISMHGERAMVQSMLEAGATGYILKDDNAAIADLPAIVRSVAGGGIFLSEQARQAMTKRKTGATDPLLTPRQLAALSLAAAYPHKKTSELAQQLGVQNSSCRNLLSTAYLRLGVNNRAAAITKAQQLGLVAALR